MENHTSDDEDVARLADINDIRNGVLVNRMIRRAFDRRLLAILKVCHFCPPICTFSDPFAATNSQTPNHILKTTDIPPCHNRTDLASDVVYPPHKHYTLQWLEDPGPADTNMIPNNSDATFKKATKKAKLSDLLLHYTYGAAAVRRWGRGTEILTKLATPPRPQVPVPAPVGPKRTIVHDRDATVRKRYKSQSTGETGAGSSMAGAETGGLVESEGQVIWDDDEVMLFFWGNSEAAKQRHLKKVGENTQDLEQWRDGVA